ncbi:hypothetical protein SLEP1_g46837 [Rubroshorea leprosula]|uniref:Serine-threonine/tyrosine-protein kinase catalytic domain-containing protein n=1 Tax=Rubroshorea leprosula TaxID=152421 RepID=A0AAV5LNJ6_9ROSI|nr:hypothetical protein SLEP1_g46837 [Rubroshorea leprosula]
MLIFILVKEILSTWCMSTPSAQPKASYDARVLRIPEKIEEADLSCTSTVDLRLWVNVRVGESGNFTDMTNIYRFGVLVLELVTGQQAANRDSIRSNEILIQWLVGSFTMEGIRNLIRLLQCMSFPGNGRPRMDMVVLELEQIHEKEMALTTVMGVKICHYRQGGGGGRFCIYSAKM